MNKPQRFLALVSLYIDPGTGDHETWASAEMMSEKIPPEMTSLEAAAAFLRWVRHEAPWRGDYAFLSPPGPTLS